MSLEQVKASFTHAIIVYFVTSAVKMSWSKWINSPAKPAAPFKEHVVLHEKEASMDSPSFRLVSWLMGAPFVCMILTPYLVNVGHRLYTGNHHSSIYVRQVSGWDGPTTIYGFELCLSDFVNLEGEYYLAIPIWCVGVLLYLGFWAVAKRGTHFAHYSMEKKIVVSITLLFSASIAGAAFLSLTFLSGFVGKLIVYVAGNIETDWSLDSLHLQIGLATLLGGIVFFVLMLQLVDHGNSAVSPYHPHSPNSLQHLHPATPPPKDHHHMGRMGDEASSVHFEDLIDFD